MISWFHRSLSASISELYLKHIFEYFRRTGLIKNWYIYVKFTRYSTVTYTQWIYEFADCQYIVWILLQVHSRWARWMACRSTGWLALWKWRSLLNCCIIWHNPNLFDENMIWQILFDKWYLMTNILSRETLRIGTRSGQREEARAIRIVSMSLRMRTSIERWGDLGFFWWGGL